MSGGAMTEAMSNPMFQAGLATLASNTRSRQRGQGGRALMNGLGAFNQAQRFQMMKQQQDQQEKLQQMKMQQYQQELANQKARKEQFPGLMSSILSPKSPEEKTQAISSMLGLQPGLASSMLSSAMAVPKQSVFAEKLSLGGIDPSTSEGQKQVLELLNKSAVQVNVGMAKPLKASELKGYQDKNTGRPPAPGTTHEELIQGDYEVVTSKPTSESGRVAMSTQGIHIIDKIRGALIKNGELDRVAIGTIGVPGTKLNSWMTEAISSIVYLKTGAAATVGEIQAQMDIYKPRMWSSLEASGDQLARMEDFFRMTAEGSGAPSGSTAAPPALAPPEQEGPPDPAEQSRRVEEILKKYNIQ